MATPITIKLNNRRGNALPLEVLLTAEIKDQSQKTQADIKAELGLSGIDFATSTPLSQITNGEIKMERINAGRLYIGYGTFPAAPVPDGSQYYGWIEFSKKYSMNGTTPVDEDTTVWINLSNVDMVGLPLSLEGFLPDIPNPTPGQPPIAGKSFSLGYNKSNQALIQQIKNKALDPNIANNKAIVAAGPNKQFEKIVAPNIVPSGYLAEKKIATYVDNLRKAQARLVICSDAPTGQGSERYFEGSFLTGSGNPILRLTSQDAAKDVLEIWEKSQAGDANFSSEIILRCDGGKMMFNGTEIDQNRVPPPGGSLTAEEIVTNSLFRNICIGINEGYFKFVGTNYSNNFSFLNPFESGEGNDYARILHETSNSYGFAYADSNLKVLLQANPAKDIALHILKEDENGGFGYDANTISNNQPNFGEFRFETGANCDLGPYIGIGNCKYLPSETNAYSGIFPILIDWTEMTFLDKSINPPQRRSILVRTDNNQLQFKDADCFVDRNNPSVVRAGKIVGNTLQWDGNIMWNPGQPSIQVLAQNRNPLARIFDFLNGLFRNIMGGN